MILPALIDYYDRVAEEPDGDIASYGFSRQKITFCVNLTATGELIEIADARHAETNAAGKSRMAPKRIVVLGQAKPSGSGINPCLLWDNASYMLGWKADDAKPERTRASFEAFRDKHLALRDEINDDDFDAVCCFLEKWDPNSFMPDDSQQEYLSSFGVFRIGSKQSYVHEQPAVRSSYLASLRNDDANGTENRPSLTDGKPSRVARLHEPKIKGVWGAQSAGATIVSFNNEAFESYGKSQGDNAPVSEHDAFKYCTALNHLLADPERHTQLGDATVVWWADAPVPDETLLTFFSSIGAGVPSEVEGKGKAEVLAAAMRDLARGEVPKSLTGLETGFNVLGLSPNQARLSVRFWWRGPLVQLFGNVAKHQLDAMLEPVPERDANKPMSIYRVVRETARILSDRPDMDTVSPTLAGELTRAILTGGQYPMSLLEAIIRRVRADGEVTHARAAITKACIIRRRRLLAGSHAQTYQEVPVSLNPDGPLPYQLGRLFAVIEKTQGDALGDVNASIRDRYFGSVSATPASVFPRLLRLSQHHITKLEGGRRVNREKLTQEVIEKIDHFPRHLNLEQQGLFQIGYYHQRQDLFTKKSEQAEEPALAE